MHMKISSRAVARSAAESRLVWMLLATLLLTVVPLTHAKARDITLGGHRQEQTGKQAPNIISPHLSDDVLPLPRLVASVHNGETGRWQRVLVDAYLQPDAKMLSQTKDHLKDIAERAKPQLQSRPAEFLEEAHGGTRAAKDCIKTAMEESLGHSWSGKIYIRSLAVF